MKLRHIVVASAVFSLGTLAHAQQDPQAQQGGQQGAQQQQMERDSSQAGPGMGQSQAQSEAAHNPQLVRQVQEKLKGEGHYDGKVDGIWGPKTQAALKKFQEDKDIDAKGELDSETLAELNVEESAGARGEGAQEGGAATGAAGQSDQDQPAGR